jgi:inosose dehydratase
MEKEAIMKIGCFALVQPFSRMQRQFEAIRELGIENADVTDNHEGGSLGVEYGFTASLSLDSHPAKIREMAQKAGVRLSAFCAHANLLDPPSPDIYSTNQIIKAIRLAPSLGIKHVITTEGDPKTDFGHKLTHDQRIFAIRERLYEPLRWAEELGIELLLETHGIVTDDPDSMEELLNALGHPDTLGICLDTGNSWIGGADPVEYVKRFPDRIKHVHWKDLGEDWLGKRGKIYGCGMGTAALGEGVVNVREVMHELMKAGFDGDTTLEIAGADAVKRSVQQLQQWMASTSSAVVA